MEIPENIESVILNLPRALIPGVVSLLIPRIKRFIDELGGLGSPDSRKYWQNRLESDISSLELINNGEGLEKLNSRTEVSLWYLDAFDAIKVMGADGRRANWLIFALFLCLSFISILFGMSLWIVLPLVAGMVLAEIAALGAGELRRKYISVLVAASKYGHGRIVRSDPWVLIATYEKYKKHMKGEHEGGIVSWADQRGGRTFWMWIKDEFVVKFGPPVGARLDNIWDQHGRPEWEPSE